MYARQTLDFLDKQPRLNEHQQYSRVCPKAAFLPITYQVPGSNTQHIQYQVHKLNIEREASGIHNF